MPYTSKLIRKNIILIEADTQEEIASMFLRPQEYYESPYVNIKGNVFTLNEYIDTYTKENGAFTYYTDWAGFNIPGHVIIEFFQKFRHDLQDIEKDFLHLISPYVKNSERFYVIGTCKSVPSALSHEIAHAYWYLFDEYKNNMQTLIDNADVGLMNVIAHKLLKMGYNEEMITDEIQAYLSTSSRHTLVESIGLKNFLNSEYQMPSQFKKYYQEFDEIQK